jgi:hypothetical protein
VEVHREGSGADRGGSRQDAASATVN